MQFCDHCPEGQRIQGVGVVVELEDAQVPFFQSRGLKGICGRRAGWGTVFLVGNVKLAWG